MTDPIRVIHFADTHIGMENYGKTDPETGLSSRVVDFLRRLDDIIADVDQNGADLIVFAGDAFKTRAPSPTYQREFAHRIRDLSQLAPVAMLVGNHDLPPMVLKASSIEIYETLAVPNVWVAHDYTGRVIDTARGPVYVAAAPYPIRARLLDQVEGAARSIQESDQYLEEALVGLLDELAEEADAHDMPRLLMGHFTVGGAKLGSERQIMLGRDFSVPRASLADPRWDYVALGHIHKHQNLTQGRDDVPPVVYSGSIERIDFGEEHDTKGYCRVDLTRGGTGWQFIPLKTRPFVTLDRDLRRSMDPTREVLDMIAAYDLRGAVVRVRLTFRPESESRFNEATVREALKAAGTFHLAALRKDVEEEARARLGDSPEGLTPLELLARYLVSKGVDAQRRDSLLEMAGPLLGVE